MRSPLVLDVGLLAEIVAGQDWYPFLGPVPVQVLWPVCGRRRLRLVRPPFGGCWSSVTTLEALSRRVLKRVFK